MTQPGHIETNPDDLRDALAGESVAVFDFETSGLDVRSLTVGGLGVYCPKAARTFYVNTGHLRRDLAVPRFPEQKLADAIQPFAGDPAKQMLMHNSEYDLRVMWKLGVDVRCRVICTIILTHRTDENLRVSESVVTTHPALDRVTYGLKQLMTIFFNIKPPTIMAATAGQNVLFAPPTDVARYCQLDVINTYDVFKRADAVIKQDVELWRLVDRIDDPNNVVTAKMMAAGILVDVDEARRQRGLYEDAIQACRDEIWRLLGRRWPLDKPKDVLRTMRHMGFDIHSPRKEVLRDAFADCSDTVKQTVIGLFLSKAQMEQRCSAFLYSLPDRVKYTEGRLYPELFRSTAVTTRFRTSPNLQNLPKKADRKTDEDGAWRKMLPSQCVESETTRDIFVAKDGYVLVSLDLSAAEPRYLAILFQRALAEKETGYWGRHRALWALRRSRYPSLMKLKEKCTEDRDYVPGEIEWPAYVNDPLWQVFDQGGDPYNALLITMDSDEHAKAAQEGREAQWLKKNRWRGKLAYLAIAYGSRAETLAPGLQWSVQRTRQAIKSLEARYATLKPFRQLTLKELIHLGEVRTLWGRPRRINGYYQLTRPDPVTVKFYRAMPNYRDYQAEIIPLGSTRNGVQAFVRRCYVEKDDGMTGEVVFEADKTGKITHAAKGDPFVRAKHFLKLPFRVINFGQIHWVRDANNLKRQLPRQSAAERQAFNAKCQVTGADHLRWLMNNVDTEVCTLEQFQDCRLILTMHDSLLYEVPEQIADEFIAAAKPVVERSPDWATIPIKVGVEVGKRFGQMAREDQGRQHDGRVGHVLRHPAHPGGPGGRTGPGRRRRLQPEGLAGGRSVHPSAKVRLHVRAEMPDPTGHPDQGVQTDLESNHRETLPPEADHEHEGEVLPQGMVGVEGGSGNRCRCEGEGGPCPDPSRIRVI